MAEWSPAAGAGTSSFGMSGTNAYALAVHPEEPPAKGFARPFKWQRLRCALPSILLLFCVCWLSFCTSSDLCIMLQGSHGVVHGIRSSVYTSAGLRLWCRIVCSGRSPAQPTRFSFRAHAGRSAVTATLYMLFAQVLASAHTIPAGGRLHGVPRRSRSVPTGPRPPGDRLAICYIV